MRVTTETGVGCHIEAAHEDRPTGKIHGHTWDVVAWHNCDVHENDAIMLQNHLKGVCAAFDHTVLPNELARGEDLARAILQLSPPTCFKVELRREPARLYATAIRQGETK